MATSETYRCLNCEDGVLAALTATCPKCGSVYRRGALISEGKLAKRPRARAAMREPDPVDFDALPWVSFAIGKTREQAIENLWAFYREHPRKYARKDPADEYEVTRASVDRDKNGRPIGMWRLTIRKR